MPRRLPALPVLLVLLAPALAAAEPGYEARVLAWRAAHEAELRADDGWLTVVGLFWLAEGTSRFGAAPDGEIVFPAGTSPARAGTLERHGDRVLLTAAPGAGILLAGKPVAAHVELRSDATGAPDVLTMGRLAFFLIARGDRLGLRVRDRESPKRKAFKGLAWYPVDARCAVRARFVPYPAGRTLEVPNVLGQAVAMPSPGRAVFVLGGKELSLDAVLEGPDAKELFFVMADGTSGKTTYPGGRFLYTDLPSDGAVTLDFNRAESPPCAFTDLATCPLPPPQNRLAVPVEAGERYPR